MLICEAQLTLEALGAATGCGPDGVLTELWTGGWCGSVPWNCRKNAAPVEEEKVMATKTLEETPRALVARGKATIGGRFERSAR